MGFFDTLPSVSVRAWVGDKSLIISHEPGFLVYATHELWISIYQNLDATRNPK